jgi:hypothetical protein
VAGASWTPTPLSVHALVLVLVLRQDPILCTAATLRHAHAADSNRNRWREGRDRDHTLAQKTAVALLVPASHSGHRSREGATRASGQRSGRRSSTRAAARPPAFSGKSPADIFLCFCQPKVRPLPLQPPPQTVVIAIIPGPRKLHQSGWCICLYCVLQSLLGMTITRHLLDRYTYVCLHLCGYSSHNGSVLHFHFSSMTAVHWHPSSDAPYFSTSCSLPALSNLSRKS